MCDPVSIAGGVMTVGSMVANKVGQDQVSRARSSAMAAERDRQAKLQGEANALNTHSQNNYVDFSKQQDDKAKTLADYFKGTDNAAPNAAVGPTETAPTSGNNIVVQEQAKQKAKANAYGDQQSTALGNLRAFGDLLGDKSRAQGRDASQIGTLDGFMQSSSGVLPLELQAANSKGSTAKLFGDILQGAGTAASMAGLAGSFGGSAAAKGLTAVPEAGGSFTPGAGRIFSGNPYVLY